MTSELLTKIWTNEICKNPVKYKCQSTYVFILPYPQILQLYTSNHTLLQPCSTGPVSKQTGLYQEQISYFYSNHHSALLPLLIFSLMLSFQLYIKALRLVNHMCLVRPNKTKFLLLVKSTLNCSPNPWGPTYSNCVLSGSKIMFLGCGWFMFRISGLIKALHMSRSWVCYIEAVWMKIFIPSKQEKNWFYMKLQGGLHQDWDPMRLARSKKKNHKSGQVLCACGWEHEFRWRKKKHVHKHVSILVLTRNCTTHLKFSLMHPL